MTRCNAIFVVLGERPELDKLERCTRTYCHEHDQQLAWVEASFPRQVAYARQRARYEAAQHTSTQAAEQSSLLAVTGES